MVKLPKLASLIEPFCTAGTLQVVNLYIREAHPSDGWELEENTSGAVMEHGFGTAREISIRQTTSLEERLAVAANFQQSITGAAAEIPLFVDDPSTNLLDIAYEAPPERLVAVDQQDRVSFCSGQGPFQYSLSALEAFLSSQ
eukprot:TRINITY_DN2092_c0_g1_i2.p2 TRINITY_DN2092_c0_g1~~TRINITY_DN2092_c0_g1_i2.p2  ORF type:complete len:142 (-),score=33.52 TRINITY_DN2092_c0_g1_i2:275-700(-)